MLELTKLEEFIRRYGNQRMLSFDIEAPIVGPSYYTFPFWNLKDMTTTYAKRKRLSEIKGQIDQMNNQRARDLEQIARLNAEASKIDTELRMEQLSKSEVRFTATKEDFEQIEIFVGAKPKKYRVQLRDSETGNVLSSFFYHVK